MFSQMEDGGHEQEKGQKNVAVELNQRIKLAQKALAGEFDFATAMREDMLEVLRSELKEMRHALAKEREHGRHRTEVLFL